MAVVINGTGGPVDIKSVDGYEVSHETGVVEAGTLRVTLASDDVAIATIPTALSDGTQKTKLVDATGTDLATTTQKIHTVQYGLNGSTPTGVAVDGSGIVQVHVTDAFATAANQTNGTQKVQTVDGSGNVIGSSLAGTTSINANVRFDESVPTPDEAHATGTGAISVSYNDTTHPFVLEYVTCKLSAAPTTHEDFTITLDSGLGAAYDVLLFKYDPADESATDIVWFPDRPFQCRANDTIKVAYTNTDTLTYGCAVIITKRKAAVT